MAVGAFFYNEPMPRERPLRARHVNALSPRTRAIDLRGELVRGRIRTRGEALLDVVQSDRRSTTATRSLRQHVAELALQPHPSLHRGFTDAKQLPELGIRTLTRLVGGNDAFTKCDWMTVNHHPDQIRNGSATQGLRIKSCEHWG